jgi:hypothetical protein
MSVTLTDPARNDALRSSAQALRRMAGYSLPPDLDRRVLDLGERKDALTPEERAELLAWVEFTQDRSIEVAEARLALQRLTAVFPELADRP